MGEISFSVLAISALYCKTVKTRDSIISALILAPFKWQTSAVSVKPQAGKRHMNLLLPQAPTQMLFDVTDCPSDSEM